MRRKLVILVALAIAALAIPGPAVSATQTRGQTAARAEVVAHVKPTLSWPRAAGWYENSGVYVNGHGQYINGPHDRDRLLIYTQHAYLYEGRQWWHLRMRYHNDSGRTLHFSCAGFKSPHVVKAHIYRARHHLREISASQTYCSSGGHGFTLKPRQFKDSWATFRGVPAIEDQVVIEWGSHGKGTPRVSMWHRKI
jgi:hypothetical protein